MPCKPIALLHVLSLLMASAATRFSQTTRPQSPCGCIFLLLKSIILNLPSNPDGFFFLKCGPSSQSSGSGHMLTIMPLGHYSSILNVLPSTPHCDSKNTDVIISLPWAKHLLPLDSPLHRTVVYKLQVAGF